MKDEIPAAEPVTRGRQIRIAALAVALIAIVGFLVVRQLDVFDPYRPGTVHRVTLQLNGCLIAGSLSLDGRTWLSGDRPPDSWPNPWVSGGQPATPIPGALTVVATDQAEFTADQGGTVSFHRLKPNQFGSMNCPIQ